MALIRAEAGSNGGYRLDELAKITQQRILGKDKDELLSMVHGATSKGGMSCGDHRMLSFE